MGFSTTYFLGRKIKLQFFWIIFSWWDTTGRFVFLHFFLGYGIDFEDIQQHMAPDVLVRKVDIFNQQWLTIWAGNHIDQIRGSR